MNESLNNRMKIGVIGMGPVGSILAAHLLESGAYVVSCDISKTRIESIKTNGIRLRHTMEKEIPVTNTCLAVVDLQEYDLDLVVISVKAPYLKSVLAELEETLAEKTFVMSGQNGLDNEAQIAQIFGNDRTLRMVINYAGNLDENGDVQVTFFNPPNYITALGAKGTGIASQLTELLNATSLETVILDDIRVQTWEKAILNAALSPVCALSQRTMRGVMETDWGVDLVKRLLIESIAVAEAEGIDLGKEFMEHCIQYLKKGGHHKPSMLIDIENNLPTEIDYLNGRIVEYGRKHSVPTPANETITTLINLLERKSK